MISLNTFFAFTFLDTEHELNCKIQPGLTGLAKNARETTNGSGCLLCWSLQSSGTDKKSVIGRIWGNSIVCLLMWG